MRKPKPSTRRALRRASVAGIFVAAIAAVGGALYLQHHEDDDDDAREPAPEVAAPRIGARACLRLDREICGPVRAPADPTGQVLGDDEGERRAAEIRRDLERARPELDEDALDRESALAVFTPARRAWARQAFRHARGEVERLIRAQPATILSAGEKRRLLARVHAVEIEFPIQLAGRAEVYYVRGGGGASPERLRLQVGGAYLLAVRSWYNGVFTFAHEIAHSIDPCELRAASLRMPAIDRVSSCLQAQDVVAARRDRAECGPNDQLSEAFADWMAVQVVARELKREAGHYSGPELLAAARNSVRDLCDEDGLAMGDGAGREPAVDTTYHPLGRARINQIFGRNPVIRDLLGCRGEDDSAMRFCAWR